MSFKDMFDALKLILAVTAALFAYWRFFREGIHQQRIELDTDFSDLAVINNERIVEIGVTSENKGYIEQRFKHIHLTLRGLIENAPLQEWDAHPPRLLFPITLHKTQLVPENDYYFVRPKVKQRFSIVLKIPSEIKVLQVIAKFHYSSGDPHDVVKAFSINITKSHDSSTH
jgi:hypothetical protein